MRHRISAAALAAFFTVAGLAAAPALADSPTTAASAAATAAPAAAPSADPATTARAKEWLGRLQSGKIDRAQLTKDMNDTLTEAMAAQVADKVGPLGAATAMSLSRVVKKNGNTFYVYNVTFPGASDWIYIFGLEDASGKVSSLLIKPA